MHGVFVSADDTVDQERRPSAHRDALLAIAGIECIGGVAQAALQLLGDLQHRLDGDGSEDSHTRGEGPSLLNRPQEVRELPEQAKIL